MRAQTELQLHSMKCFHQLIGAALLCVGLLASPKVLGAQRDTACVALMERFRLDSTADRRKEALACVKAVDSDRRSQPRAAMRAEINRLAEIPWFIPEYHDEQRLFDGVNALGPMAFIYASPYLHGFTTLAQIIEHGSVGFLAALVYVDTMETSPLPGTYQNLHLKRGINCVWLSYDTTAPAAKRWAAKINQPGNDHPCDRSDEANMKSLAVVQGITTSSENVPPVARFGEGHGNQPILGFKCLNGWCEAGPSGAVSPSRDPSNTVAGREGKVKGWHDEQRLADRVGGKFVPTFRASVVPDPRVGTYTVSDFTGGWKQVAIIELPDGDPPAGSKYRNWGLKRGQNRLEIRNSAAGGWEARLWPAGATTAAGAKTWYIIDRMPHYDAAVPATARWRWTILDDGVWVPCGQACCQAEGPLSAS